MLCLVSDGDFFGETCHSGWRNSQYWFVCVYTNMTLAFDGKMFHMTENLKVSFFSYILDMMWICPSARCLKNCWSNKFISHHSGNKDNCRDIFVVFSNTAPVLWPFFSGPPRWAGARRELPDFMVQGKINRGKHTDHLPSRHSIRTNQCPPPSSPHFL